MRCLCGLGLWSPTPIVPPAVAPRMMLQWQGQEMNMYSLPWARSGHISVTGKAATYLRIQPLADVIFSAEYSCPPPCCPTSLPLGTTPVKNRLLAEELWGENPFSSPGHEVTTLFPLQQTDSLVISKILALPQPFQLHYTRGQQPLSWISPAFPS